MGAPAKPKDKLKNFRGYFYLTPELEARLKAESARRGGASISDIVRWALQKELPRAEVSVSVSPDNKLSDLDSS